MPNPVVLGPRCNIQVACNSTDLDRSEAWISVDPNDPYHLVVISRRFQDPLHYISQLEIQYSLDGGRSWHTPTSTLLPLAGTSIYSMSDPWVGIDTKGNVYASGLPVVQVANPQPNAPNFTDGVAVYFYQSHDGGKTWNGPIVIDDQGGEDAPFGAIDISNGKHQGRIYMVWMASLPNPQFGTSGSTIALAYSDDEGQTWNKSKSAVSGFNLQPNYEDMGGVEMNRVAVGPDGTVHIVGIFNSSQNNQNPSILYGRSTDGGDTFQWGFVAQNQELAGMYQVAMIAEQQIPAICVGPNGHIAVAWVVDQRSTFGSQNAVNRVYMAQCTDNGVGWATGNPNLAAQSAGLLALGTLSDTCNDQYFLPQLAVVLSEGTIGCAFYHWQPKGTIAGNGFPNGITMVHLAVLQTADNFAFPSIVQVSDQSFDTSINPVYRYGGKLIFYGDFMGLGASPLGFFPLWTDTRNGSQQQFVSRLAVNPCDTYIRHFLVDQGNLAVPPKGQTVFDSPDLVVRLKQDGNLAGNFVSQPVPFKTKTIYVYGRVWNNGPNDARNVSLSVSVAGFSFPLQMTYPYDWFPADWVMEDFTTHIHIATLPINEIISAGKSATVGPFVINVPNIVDLGDNIGILATVLTDNDDSDGGLDGCPLQNIQNSCTPSSFFWQTNNASMLILQFSNISSRRGGTDRGGRGRGHGQPKKSEVSVHFKAVGVPSIIMYLMKQGYSLTQAIQLIIKGQVYITPPHPTPVKRENIRKKISDAVTLIEMSQLTTDPILKRTFLKLGKNLFKSTYIQFMKSTKARTTKKRRRIQRRKR